MLLLRRARLVSAPQAVTYLAVTGHRPNRLGGYSVQPRLDHFALGVLARVGATRVYTGMAQGWDQAIAAACVALDIPFVAVLPGFAPGCSQSNRWPAPARERYDRLLAAADGVERLPFPGAGREYHMRDQRIAEAGSWLLALWDGDARSGTGMTVRMARVPVVNVWEEWTSL